MCLHLLQVHSTVQSHQSQRNRNKNNSTQAGKLILSQCSVCTFSHKWNQTDLIRLIAMQYNQINILKKQKKTVQYQVLVQSIVRRIVVQYIFLLIGNYLKIDIYMRYMSVLIQRFLKIIEKKFKSVYVHYNVGHKFHFFTSSNHRYLILLPYL